MSNMNKFAEYILNIAQEHGTNLTLSHLQLTMFNCLAKNNFKYNQQGSYQSYLRNLYDEPFILNNFYPQVPSVQQRFRDFKVDPINIELFDLHNYSQVEENWFAIFDHNIKRCIKQRPLYLIEKYQKNPMYQKYVQELRNKDNKIQRHIPLKYIF